MRRKVFSGLFWKLFAIFLTDQTIANYLLLVFTGISIPFFMFLVPQRSERLDIDLQGGRYINDDVSGTEIE